ncbi:MAG: hypothetical protein J0M15_06720 [Deltaproteobacteria bacterium]|jgi:Zn finger protein HypA/HybF involved in hydrogenase expression|nr:hypothetical protein [Deltaproteobacteria bacterium]
MNQITTENSTITNSKDQTTLKIRCPQCISLYEVHSSKINTSIAEFVCPKCQSLFGFNYPPSNPSAILTFLISLDELELKKSCPKCHHFQSEKNLSCESCGVVIENYLLIQNENYPKVPVELIKQWQQIFLDFESKPTHETFIRKCISRGKIDYALFKYKELSKTMNDPKLYEFWSEYIRSMTKVSKTEININRMKSGFFDFNPAKIKSIVFFLFILIGSSMILLGLFNFNYRNSIGGGIALLILTFGFTVFRQHD